MMKNNQQHVDFVSSHIKKPDQIFLKAAYESLAKQREIYEKTIKNLSNDVGERLPKNVQVKASLNSLIHFG